MDTQSIQQTNCINFVLFLCQQCKGEQQIYNLFLTCVNWPCQSPASQIFKKTICLRLSPKRTEEQDRPILGDLYRWAPQYHQVNTLPFCRSLLLAKNGNLQVTSSLSPEGSQESNMKVENSNYVKIQTVICSNIRNVQCH